MKRFRAPLIALIAAALGISLQQVSAQDLLKYSYLDAAYQFNDYKNIGGDGGHGARGVLSISPVEHLFFIGRVNASSAEGDIESEKVDYFRLRVGGGGYLPLGDPFHLTGEVGVTYTDFNTEIDELELSQAGFYARPGVRFAAGEFVELNAAATFSSVDNEEVAITFGAGLNLLENLQLNGEAEFQDEVNLYSIGLRAQW